MLQENYPFLALIGKEHKMKLLRKLNFIFLVVITFLVFGFSNHCKATTKEDVIAAINKTYTVGEETFRLPQKIIDKGINYLNKNPLTEAQYNKILNCISKGVALANEIGTTNIDEISDEDLDRALLILAEVADSVDVDLNEELAEQNDVLIGKTETPNNEVLPNTSENQSNPPTNVNSNNNLEKNNNSNSEKIDNSNNKKNDVGAKDSPNSKTNDAEIKDKTSNVGLEDKSNSSSGEKIEKETSSGDGISYEKEENKKVDNTALLKRTKELSNQIKKIYNIVLNVVIVFIILFIFIFCLLLKMKKHKILKRVLLVLVSIISIILVTSVILAIMYQQKIVVAVKLYYILK